MFWMIECLEDAEELLSVRFFFIVPRRWSLDCCRVVFSCSSSRLSRLLRPVVTSGITNFWAFEQFFFWGYCCQVTVPRFFQGCLFVVLLLLPLLPLLLIVVSRRQCGKQVCQGGDHPKEVIAVNHVHIERWVQSRGRNLNHEEVFGPLKGDELWNRVIAKYISDIHGYWLIYTWGWSSIRWQGCGFRMCTYINH